LADCFAAVKPNELQLKKFYSELDKKRQVGELNEEDYFLLRSYGVSNKYLQERTLGDANLFDDKILEEILEDVKNEIIKLLWKSKKN
jgi:hypothetical protein